MNRFIEILIFTLVCFVVNCPECTGNSTEVESGWESYRKGNDQAAERYYFIALEKGSAGKSAS